MPNPSKKSVESITADDPRMKWPMSVQALNMTGLSKRSLENAVRAETVSYVYDPQGNRHFDPDSLQEIAGVVSDTEVEADLSKVVIEQARKSIKDLTEANKDLMRLTIDAMGKNQTILRKENRALRGRCRDLERKHLENIEAFEAALNSAHERELGRLQAESREKRLDAGFNKLLEQVPTLIDQFTGKQKVASFVDSLTGDQKELIFDMLRDDQAQALLGLMAKLGSNRDKPSRSPTGSAEPSKEQTGSQPEANKE